MYLLQFIFLYFLVEILCKKLKISQTLVHHLNQNFDRKFWIRLLIRYLIHTTFLDQAR